MPASTALQSVMAAIDEAVFAFDMDAALVLVNPAGERLIGRPAAELVGRRADELRLVAYLSGDVPRLIEQPFGPSSGRLELRRSRFRREGRPHDLLVFADLRRALREEEQQAWQRIVRVLSHEINNSLTPIKSIAHSVKPMIARADDVPRAADIQEALSLIETRSGALGRFLRAYAQLARLPRPQPRPFDLAPLVHRVVDLEDRGSIGIRAASDIRHRARAEPPDRRSARRDTAAGEPAGSSRLPRDSEPAGRLVSTSPPKWPDTECLKNQGARWRAKTSVL